MTKITELADAVLPLDSTDLIEVVQDVGGTPVNKKVAALELGSSKGMSSFQSFDLDTLGVTDMTSASYVDVENASFTVDKFSAASKLAVQVMMSGYAFGSSLGADIAVSIGGVDYQIGEYFFNQTSVHQLMGGIGVIDGLAAGTTIIQLRWRRTSGTGTLRTDSNDFISMMAHEQ